MRKRAVVGWAGFGLSLLMLCGGALTARAEPDSDAKGWLGIFTQSLTSSLKEGMDYSGDGVLVTRVVSGSPADRAGIEKGDVIVSVDRQSVDSPDRLAEVVGSAKPGDEISIRLVHDGERRTVRATLSARDDSGKNSDRDEIDTPEVPPIPDMSGVPSREDIRRMIESHGNETRLIGPMRGRLGVRVENPEGDEHGALVSEVVDDSPAKKAGIHSGDIITKVDDTSIDDSSDLIDALRGKSGHVSLEIRRHGDRRTFEVDLGSSRSEGDSRVRVYQFHSPGGSGQDSGDGDRASLRREIADLRAQIEQLRRELDELKREK